MEAIIRCNLLLKGSALCIWIVEQVVKVRGALIPVWQTR